MCDTIYFVDSLFNLETIRDDAPFAESIETILGFYGLIVLLIIDIKRGISIENEMVGDWNHHFLFIGVTIAPSR